MRFFTAAVVLAGLFLLGGCSPGGLFARLFGAKTPAPPPNVHFVIGEPYPLGGMWRYPRVQYTDDETGLAAIDGAHPPLTTDGEPFDEGVLAASHPTVQLPAIALVTNLETGLAVEVRVNDRGPARPSRLVGLTRRAATLIGAHDGTRVRFQALEGPSRQLAAELGGDGPKLTVALAAAGTVRAEALAPPPGARAAERVRTGATLTQAAAAIPAVAEGPSIPLRLPERVTQSPATGGNLYVDAGGFSDLGYARLYADRLAALGGHAATDYAAPRDRAFFVRMGPFATVAEADAGLDRALRAGVTDARIVVAP